MLPSPPEVSDASSSMPPMTTRSDSVMAGTIWRTPPRNTSQSLRYSLTTPSGDQLKA